MVLKITNFFSNTKTYDNIFVFILANKDEIDNSLGKIVLMSGVVDFNDFKKRNVLMTNNDTKIQVFEI
jgi:hypothetical protein